MGARIPKYTIQELASDFFDILKSDRDVFIATAGMTGEGKSVAMIQLLTEYSKIAGVKFTMDHLTWSRDELLNWIDGEGESRKGQKPEYTALLPDELISMFYKRNWYEDEQKAAIELFNKCRDRHLLVAGNVPNFFDLDSGVLSRFRFYIFIPKRGVMWVFKQEDNPFAADKWNVAENRKLFRKKKHPYACPNFLCEIYFNDLAPDEKKRYYEVRNRKRVNTENQNKGERVERYGKVKTQRDKLIRRILKHQDVLGYTVADLSDITGLSESYIYDINSGRR